MKNKILIPLLALSINHNICIAKSKLIYDEKFVIPLDNLSSDHVIHNKKIYDIHIDHMLLEFLNCTYWIWEGNESSFWEIIITTKDNKKYKFADFCIWNKWADKFQKHTKIKNPYFIYLDLGENNHVIALKGSEATSPEYCGLLTLIHLPKEGEPIVIFNTLVRVLEIIENSDKTSKIRVRFGKYITYLPERIDDKGMTIPRNPDDVYICDIYIKNNELIVEKLPLTYQQVLATISKEDLEKMYG